MKKIVFTLFFLYHAASLCFPQKEEFTEHSLDSIVKKIIDIPCTVKEAFIEINNILPEYRVYYELYDFHDPEFEKGYVEYVLVRIGIVIPQEKEELFITFHLKSIEDANNKNNKKFWPKRNQIISYTPINIHRFKYRKIRKYTVVDITIYRKPKTQN